MRNENDTPFMVKRFPAPSYSCKILRRSKCAHVLAVMQAYGHLKTDGYKLPILSQLTRSKRSGKLNGQKGKGHSRNAKTEVANNNDRDSDNFLSKEHEKSHDKAESREVDVET